jgi:hypothetical protein
MSDDDDADAEDNGMNEEEDDQYERGASRNLRGSNSTRASFLSAERRFNQFCRDYLTDDDMDFFENEIVGEDLSPDRPWTFESLSKELFPYKLMDYYAEYLAKHAKSSRGGGNAPLKLETAKRYFSAIKENILVGLANAGKSNPALNKEAIARIYAGMLRIFKQAAYDGNHNLVDPHRPAETDDILTASICCIWTANYRYAAFFNYFLSLIQLAGRASEIARIPWRNLALINPKEFEEDRDNKIAEIKLCRSKTLHMQECSIFPHQKEFLLDWYFSMAYAMVMQLNTPTETNEYMFPIFAGKADEAVASNSNQQRNQQEVAKNKAVTQLYNNMLRDLMSQCVNLSPYPYGNVAEDDDLDPNGEARPPRTAASYVGNFGIHPKLTSHSNKKHAVQIADEVPCLKTTWVSFRVGWAMEAAHTIFDYLVSNRKNDQQVGKALSGWRLPDVHGRLWLDSP